LGFYPKTTGGPTLANFSPGVESVHFSKLFLTGSGGGFWFIGPLYALIKVFLRMASSDSSSADTLMPGVL
jgi:hypothetical protein